MLIHLEKLGKTFGEKVVLHDVTASVEREDRIGIVGQNGAGKTTLLKILTGEYQDYEGEFSVTHGVTLGYLEQNAKLDATLDLYGEMRSTFAPVLDAMAQMQVLERKMAAQPDDTELLARHDQLQNIVDAADGYNMDVNIKKVLSGMGFAQDTWQKNIAVLSGGELTRLRLAKLLLEKPDVLILDEPTAVLTPQEVEDLFVVMRQLKADGKSIIIITHKLKETMADTRESPELSFTLGQAKDRAGEPFSKDIGVKFTLPLSTDSRNRPKSLAASAELTEATVARDLLFRQLQAELDASRYEWQLTTEAEQYAMRRYSESQKTYGWLKKAFQNGQLDLPTYLKTENEKFDAELALNRARLEKSRAIARYNQAIGVLP